MLLIHKVLHNRPFSGNNIDVCVCIYIYTGCCPKNRPKIRLLGLFCFAEILCFCGFWKEKDPKIDPKLGQRVSKLRPAWNLNQNMPNLRATSEQIQGKKKTQSKTCFWKLYWYCRNKMILRKNGSNFLGQRHPKITIFGKRQVKKVVFLIKSGGSSGGFWVYFGSILGQHLGPPPPKIDPPNPNLPKTSKKWPLPGLVEYQNFLGLF